MKALVIDECADKMRKAVTHLQAEFAALRTGRASSSVVEKLRVDAYGSDVPLQQLAGFGVPEPRVLTISPYDKGTIKAIEKAILQSDLGVNPSNDGQVIRLVFPELTEDRRKELVKVARNRAEEGRVAVRNARRHARHELEGLEKDGEISKDDLDRTEKDLEKRTHEVVAEVDELLKHKEQELLSI
ncbi:MAG TPA: ribosome recycling factor [Acidimicrobiia bacterium]|nr:ribosome recycling factor [Acidimicrobiia bacterium]